MRSENTKFCELNFSFLDLSERWLLDVFFKGYLQSPVKPINIDLVNLFCKFLEKK